MRSQVHHNVLEDNTDIDLVVGGGTGCDIFGNTITNTYHHAFGGLQVGWFPNGGGNHSGVSYRNNSISSLANKLAFGLIVGFHPWNPLQPVVNAGTVSGNQSSGAVVNLAVDGINAGTVQDNTVSGARGTEGFNCNIPADYTAIHFGSDVSLQTGWIARHYHPVGCGSQ